MFIMIYNGYKLTKKDFNDVVSGVKREYPCYTMTGRPFKYNDISGRNSICLISYQFLKDEILCRKYIHIGYYNNIEHLQDVDLSEICIPEYHIIPVNLYPEEVIESIIQDIKEKHKDNFI